ncbi:MAG: glycosyltransferase [Dissulfurispiraceae bacterium]
MSVYVSEVSRELGRAGYSVDIYTCAESGRHSSEVFLFKNVRLIQPSVGHNRHVTKSTLIGSLQEVFSWIDAYVKGNHIRYDILHSHYWLSGVVGRLAQEQWHVPQVVMFHTTGMAKRVACSHEREPILRLIAEKRLGRESDRVLTTTEREKNLLIRYYDVPKGKIGVVPCGVNLERFLPIMKDQARQALGLQDSHHIVLYVGRLAPVKGVDRLMGAAAHLRFCRGIKFIIIGGDDQRTLESHDLGRLARRSYVDDIVRFQGRVEHDLLPLYYSAADVLVVPSYYESFGLVALEALACGTPVIATRTGAMDILIQDGKTGLLLDTLSPGTLASAIQRLIIDSPTGILSREEIRASVLRYAWPNIASAVAQEYTSVLDACILQS